jgi:hypothetical protein
VWIVLTHIIPPLAGQRLDLLGYLDAIGHRQTAITVPSRRPLDPPLPAEAILYDLSDRERLRQMTAAAFPLQGAYTRTARACTEGPISMVFGARPIRERSGS